MDQTATLLLDEAKRELTLKPRCGTCRIYPGHGQLCEERGRPVYAVSHRCRVYDAMSPAEFAELKEKQRAYYLEHKEEMAEKQRAYRLEHKEEMAEKQRAYRLEHKEEMAEKKRAYYLEHKEEMAEKQRAKKAEAENAVKALQKLRIVDPELYEQLLEEAQR